MPEYMFWFEGMQSWTSTFPHVPLHVHVCIENTAYTNGLVVGQSFALPPGTHQYTCEDVRVVFFLRLCDFIYFEHHYVCRYHAGSHVLALGDALVHLSIST